MSTMRRLLNPWLKTVEKRRIRKGTPAQIRRALETQSRLFFHGPRGVRRKWVSLNGVDCLELMPTNAAPDRVLLYIHGGAFVFGSPDTHRAMIGSLAQRLGARAVLPRYRLAPEAAFPAAPEDVRAAWDGLIASGVDPNTVVIGGDSAGGALAFGLISALCGEGGALPGGVFAFSPLTDLTYSGESFRKNASVDAMLPAESADELSTLFLRGAPADVPTVSPLFGDFYNAPPSWITVGDTEILLDDARRLSDRLTAQGCDTTLVVEHDLPHVWPIFHNILPEGRATLDALAEWIRQQQHWASES